MSSREPSASPAMCWEASFDAGAFLTVGRDNDDDYIALTPFEDGLYPLGTGIVPGTMVFDGHL